MYKIATLNKISHKGLERFSDRYSIGDDVESAAGILVRSQDMHSMTLSNHLLAIARAGAGVNNIPVDECSKKVSSYSTRRVPMPMRLRNLC